MFRTVTLAALVLTTALVSLAQSPQGPQTFFKNRIGLRDDQIAAIARGTAVVKVLPSRSPDEIFVFGAVFVNAAPEDYIKLAFNIEGLRNLPNYLGIGLIGIPPKLSDLKGFTLEPEDISDLKDCRPGDCEVQLPAEAMQEFQQPFNWSAPDVATQVNDRLQKRALGFLSRYQERGNSVLGTYHDKDQPFNVRAQLQSWLGRSDALTVDVPELNRYLLDYPNVAQANAESLFYWEKVKFGLKPTLRLNHAITYRLAGPTVTAHVVAIKQLYASHYFQLALDLTACVTEHGRSSDRGFYLISLKGSRQHGLTGFKGSLLRKAVVSKTRDAQEKALIGIKTALERR